MRFGILGELRVSRGGEVVAIERRQARLLLARLLVDANTVVTVDRLVDDMWGDRPPATAVGALQAHVSRLRRLLEPDRPAAAAARVLVSRSHGYALLVDPACLDAECFVALADRGHAAAADGRPYDALRAFDEALGLWRGDVLADLADESFVVPVATRLQGRRAAVREERAAALLATGAPAAAIEELERLVAQDDTRERPWELLLTALHTTGRTVEALERYRSLRSRLADDLGLDPGPSLQALEAAMLRGEPLGTAASPALTRRPTGVRAAATPVLVGRRHERRLLEAALAGAVDGRTAWAVVAGPSGIGKSQLVDHLTAVARDHGVAVAVGHCHEGQLTPAFWPWVQALRDLGSPAPEGSTVLDPDVPTDADPTGRVFALFQRVADALVRASAHQPLLVVLEDLHWADTESLQLIQFLAVHLRAVPIVFALTARRDEAPEEVRHVLAELGRVPGHVRVEPPSFDTTETAALVAAITGADVDPDTAAAVSERTGGNPFFVTELARLGESALRGGVLPDTVREALARRLSRLGDEVQDLLVLAAVLGAEFDLDALLATSELDAGDTIDRLDAALAADVIVPTEGPTRLRFAHALIREAVLDDVPDLRRRRLHLRIATALRDRVGDPASWRAEVAHHLLAAAPLGDPGETLAAARAAAEVAESRLAFHEAARWWAGALRVLEWDRTLGADQRERLDLLVSLGRALGDGGDQPGAIGRLAEAIDVAEQLDDTAAMVAAALAFERVGGIWYWSEYGERPVAHLERLGRVLAAVTDDPEARIRILALAAVGEGYGDLARGRALADEALALARADGRPDLIATALVAVLRAHWSHEHRDAQLARVRELLDIAGQHHLPEMELHGLTHLLMQQLVAGELEAAEQTFRRADALSHRLGLVLFRAQLSWTAATFPRARGDLASAEALLWEASERHLHLQVFARDGILSWTRVVLALERGTLHDIGPEERRIIAASFPEGEVALRLHDGDRDGARALLDALCHGPPIPERFDRIGRLTLRARLAADLDAVDLAAPLLEALAPSTSYFGAIGMCTTCGPVATEVGRLQSLLGDHDGALTTLQAAHDRARAAGWPVWAERARAALEVARSRQDVGVGS